MSRLILAVDVETSGLDPAKDQIVELGWALYDPAMRELVLSGGAYVEGGEVSPEIQRITGIRPEWVKTFGRPLGAVLSEIGAYELRSGAVAICAHNAPFDRAFIAAGIASERLSKETFNRPWIDTLTDLPLEKEPDSKKLRYLALDHGLGPALSHRAQFDAILCAQLVGRYDLDKVLERASSPSVVVRAEVSYDERQLAKDAGFRWETLDGIPKKFTKTWVKAVKRCDLAALREAATSAKFRVVEVLG